MAVLMKGMDAVNLLKEKMAMEVDRLKQKGITPGLAIVRLGANPDDLTYERTVVKRCESLGVSCRVFDFPAEIKSEDFLHELKKIVQDVHIHGILVFRPLPAQIDESAVKNIIDPAKDIDCLNPINLAKVFEGDQSGFYPCTAEAVMEMLDFNHIPLEGKNTVIIGRSMVVGKPLAMMMLKKNATITVCHSKTKDLKEICKSAEIVIAAIGKAKFVTKDFIAKGSVVVDVGINIDARGNLCGDVDFEEVSQVASHITPVPGGIGAITSSILIKHVIRSAQNSTGI